MLEDKTYKDYRRPPIKMIGMILRYLLASKQGKTCSLGNFEILGNAKQFHASTNLFEYILKRKGNMQQPHILQHVHPLLDALVRQKVQNHDHIACAADQAACLSSLRSENHFQLANSLTGDCAKTQHMCFAVVCHCVRLENAGQDKYSAITSNEESVDSGHDVEMPDAGSRNDSGMESESSSGSDSVTSTESDYDDSEISDIGDEGMREEDDSLLQGEGELPSRHFINDFLSHYKMITRSCNSLATMINPKRAVNQKHQQDSLSASF